VMTGVLRLGIHTGVGFDLPKEFKEFDVSAGVDAVIFADIAEFTTNITVTPNGDDCEIIAEEVSISFYPIPLHS
jgi:hypothetical protein